MGFADKYGEVGLGPQRADAMVRAKSVLDQGISLSYHSDLPMGPSAPLYLAWAGVNRITPSGRVAGPELRISVDAALRAITIDAAYFWKKENEIGSIALGKIANFTILEQDPYVVDRAALKDIPVWGTLFEGRVFPVPAAYRKAERSRGPAAPQYAGARFLPFTRYAREPSAAPCELSSLARAAVLAYSEAAAAQR